MTAADQYPPRYVCTAFPRANVALSGTRYILLLYPCDRLDEVPSNHGPPKCLKPCKPYRDFVSAGFLVLDLLGNASMIYKRAERPRGRSNSSEGVEPREHAATAASLRTENPSHRRVEVLPGTHFPSIISTPTYSHLCRQSFLFRSSSRAHLWFRVNPFMQNSILHCRRGLERCTAESL